MTRKKLSKKVGKKRSSTAHKAQAKTHAAKKSKKKKKVSKAAKKVTPKSGGQGGKFKLPKDLAVKMYDEMLCSRVIEERLIKIYKMGEAYFWIGGPGEEAWGVALGNLVKKGQGVDHDWLHLHYRCTPTLVAMGMPMIDPIRLIMNKATDRSTGGRNFAGHYCYPEWNVAPVSSPIEVQYSFAIGTAWAQHRQKAKGISIVSGGDAGTAEGDFASSLIWSSRPGQEIPLLLTVQNNKWGISTNYDSQHGEPQISDRGKAFGIKSETINGNDLEESYFKTKEAMDYVRSKGKPFLLETRVSRLYGHSSASGANFVSNEEDCLATTEELLIKQGLITEEYVAEKRKFYDEESRRLTEQVRGEPDPSGESIWDHTYVENENADWRKF